MISLNFSPLGPRRQGGEADQPGPRPGAEPRGRLRRPLQRLQLLLHRLPRRPQQRRSAQTNLTCTIFFSGSK